MPPRAPSPAPELPVPPPTPAQSACPRRPRSAVHPPHTRAHPARRQRAAAAPLGGAGERAARPAPRGLEAGPQGPRPAHEASGARSGPAAGRASSPALSRPPCRCERCIYPPASPQYPPPGSIVPLYMSMSTEESLELLFTNLVTSRARRAARRQGAAALACSGAARPRPATRLAAAWQGCTPHQAHCSQPRQAGDQAAAACGGDKHVTSYTSCSCSLCCCILPPFARR